MRAGRQAGRQAAGHTGTTNTETMSGRLIILPKKSYNPWKPENVERVLRDERLERERQGQLQEADRKKQSEDRVELLKKKRKRDGSNDGGSSGRSDRDADHAVSGEDAALGHVNLFAYEEKAMMEKAVAGAEGSASEAGTKKGSSSSGIMPVYLGGEEAARRRGEKATPFYLQPSFQDKSLGGVDGVAGIVGTSSNAHIEEAEAIRLRKDERLKTKMDPMHDFCKHSGSRTSKAESHSTLVKDDIDNVGVDERRRKKHRRKRRDSYSSSSSSSESDSSSSSSDEDNSSQRRKKKRRERRGHDNNKRRSDSRRRSSARKDGRHRREKKRSTKKPVNDDTALPSGASTLSIDEMRRRRQLREQKEAERSFMARLEDHSLAGASGHNSKYQDQYNPSLSRH